MLRSSEEQVAVAADAPQTTPERLRLSRDLMVRLSAAAMLRLNGGCSSLSPQAPSSCCNKNEVPRSPVASRRQLFGRASRTDTSSSKAPELSAAVGAAAETTPASPTTRADCCIFAAHLTAAAAADSRLSQSASAPSAPRQTRRAPEVKCHLAAGGTSNAAPPPATTPQGCSYAARPLAQQTCLQSRGGVSQRRQSVSDKKTPQSSSAVFHLCCEENASKLHNYNYELSETVILGSNLIYKQRPNSIQLLHSSSQSCCCCYCVDARSNKKQEPEIEVNRSDIKNKDNKNVVESGDANARLSSSSSSEICFSVFASTKPTRTGTTTTTKTTERITTQLFNGPNDDNGARNEGADLEPKRRQRPKKRRQNEENLPSRTRQKKNVAIETGSAPKNPPKQTTTTTSRPVKFHRCTSRQTSKLAMLWTILCTMLLFCTCLHTGLSLKPEVTLHSNSSEQTIKLTATTTTRAPTALRLQASGAREQDELNRAIMATMSTAAPDSVAGSGSFGQQGGNNNSWARRRPEPEADADVDQSAMLESGFGGGGAPNDLQQSPQQATMLGTASMAFDRFIEFGRIFIMGAIIVGDICGNSLVILSVCRHSKLRVTTNWFVVSLACADILVALFAMTFNASVIISGRWLFSRWVCDFWNSCDVLASTASILHLCCISIDRYIAIMRPLDYPMKITTKRVMYALCAVWISSALLSYIPIFTGIYTTQEHIKWLKDNPDQCEFVVNRVYAIVSSSISFWIPCCIMVFTYYRIYREATRQEKFIYKTQAIMPAPQPSANHHSHHHSHHNNNATNSASRSKTRRSKSMAVVSGSGLQSSAAAAAAAAAAGTHKPPTIGRPAGATFELPALKSVASKQATSGSGATSNPATTTLSTTTTTTLGDATDARLAQKCIDEEPDVNNNNNNNSLVVDIQRPTTPQLPTACNQQQDDADRDSNSGQSTPTKRSISKMKREHKAAKTLGIIMGVFILCWLPFFSWYTPQHICGKNCDGMVPHSAVTILFWIGYFNSTLNPIIYAYFNHEFRDAFKKTLQWIFCCCTDLKCLRVNRPNENQHYNCTYRSTQEIGLVSNG